MRKGGGKSKGAAFEREVCTKLSLWISEGKRKDLFWRSAMSGGRATVHGKGGVRLSAQAGDITSIDPLGNRLTDRFVIECKFYRDLELQAALLTGKGKLAKFWKQAVSAALDHNRQPLLIAKQNHAPPLLLMRYGLHMRSVTARAYLSLLSGAPALFFLSDMLEKPCRL